MTINTKFGPEAWSEDERIKSYSFAKLARVGLDKERCTVKKNLNLAQQSISNVPAALRLQVRGKEVLQRFVANQSFARPAFVKCHAHACAY